MGKDALHNWSFFLKKWPTLFPRKLIGVARAGRRGWMDGWTSRRSRGSQVAKKSELPSAALRNAFMITKREASLLKTIPCWASNPV